jgi:hypothetical protein
MNALCRSTKNNVIRNVTDKYKRWQNITILTVNTAMDEEEMDHNSWLAKMAKHVLTLSFQ